VLAGAVVATIAVTVCVLVAVICTEELDRLQIGASVTTGVMLQVKLTVPLNDSHAATTSLNFADCPELTVWEATLAEISKPGAVVLMSTPTVPSVPQLLTGGIRQQLSRACHPRLHQRPRANWRHTRPN
jgi:hypothetical protein